MIVRRPGENLYAVAHTADGTRIRLDLGPDERPYADFIDVSRHLDLPAMRAWAAQNVHPTDDELAPLRQALPDGPYTSIAVPASLRLCTTQRAKQFYLEAHGDPSQVAPSILADQANLFTQRGFTYGQYAAARRAGIDNAVLARPEMTPERVGVVTANPHLVGDVNTEGWRREGVLTAELDVLRGIIDDDTDRYRVLAATIRPEHGDRVVRASAAGLTDRQLIEEPLDQDPVTLAALRSAYPRVKADRIAHLAHHGHDPASVKKWGVAIAVKYQADQLDRSEMTPAQVRSLTTRYLQLADARQWAKAGFDTPEEVDTWLHALSGSRSAASYVPSEIAAIRDTGVAPEHVKAYTSAVHFPDRLKPSQARRIKRLAQTHPDPLVFRDRAKFLAARPEEYRADPLGAVEQIAKMTPDEVKEAIDAGQPLGTLSEYRKETQ